MILLQCKYCQCDFKVHPYRVKSHVIDYCGTACKMAAKLAGRQPVDVGEFWRVPLTKGRFAKVCKCHFDLIKNNVWSVTGTGYAATRIDNKLLRMHNVIAGKRVDHTNEDKLDNRCANLRESTHQQNCWNQSKSRGKTGVRGVYFERGKFSAHLFKDGEYKLAKTFDAIEDAIIARRAAEKMYFGEYAPQESGVLI